MCGRFTLIDLGSSRRGVDMGPSALRYVGLVNAIRKLKIDCTDLGNIDVKVPKNIENGQDSKMRYIDEITRVNGFLAQMVRDSMTNGNLPLIIGGDHSIAIGSVLGSQTVNKNIGVLWMDAHGDF